MCSQCHVRSCFRWTLWFSCSSASSSSSTFGCSARRFSRCHLSSQKLHSSSSHLVRSLGFCVIRIITFGTENDPHAISGFGVKYYHHSLLYNTSLSSLIGGPGHRHTSLFWIPCMPTSASNVLSSVWSFLYYGMYSSLLSQKVRVSHFFTSQPKLRPPIWSMFALVLVWTQCVAS